MATYECDDFRVSFQRIDRSTYTVTARAADGREAQSSFSLPMTADRLEEAILQLGRMRSISREVAPDTVTAVRANAEQLGAGLGNALFDSTLGPFYDEAKGTAAANKRGIRLTLSLASTPELLSVPWELLYRRRSFLASQRKTPVVRYLEVGDTPPPERIEGTVRVLGVVASPAGLPVLDVGDERARVEQALAGMRARGRVDLDWCDPATPRSLRERLRDGSYHILHYVGHSDFTVDGAGLLFLEDDAGGPAPVTEAVLTNLLGDQTSLRLAVLNSCEGARTTLTDPFAGIATSLVALGVPAVVAMQFTISDRAAIVFAGELFTSLIGRQYPIDASVAEARKAVFTEVNEIEWATPVLFLRSADGELFDFAADPVALPLPVPATAIVVDDVDVDHADPKPAIEPVAPPISQPADQVAKTVVDSAARVGSSWWSPRRMRWAGLVIAAAAAGAIIAAVWPDDAPHRPNSHPLQVLPTSGGLDTVIVVSGEACPAAPNDAQNTGLTYWLDAEIDGKATTIVSHDITQAPVRPWIGRLTFPAESSPDIDYRVGAVCWANVTGSADNYSPYDTVEFDLTEP